jgi:hypothetical protein
MSTHHRLAHRSTALVAALLIALTVPPTMAIARPAGDGLGQRSEKFVEPPASAPYVLRPTVNEKFADAPRPAPYVLRPTVNEKFADAPAAGQPAAPTVVRTVVKEEAVRALPIALASAALLIALLGTGYVLVRIRSVRPQLRV